MKKILISLLIMAIAASLMLAACTNGGTVSYIQVTQTQTVTQPAQTITQPAQTITQTITETATVTTTPLPITTTSPPITVTTTVTQEPPQPEQAYLVTDELSYIITKKTDYYWYFSWQVTIKNITSYVVDIYIEVEFLDKDGFLIDWDNESKDFNPNEKKTLRGEWMIDASVAPDVVEAVLGEVTLHY